MNFKIDKKIGFLVNGATILPCPECQSGKLVWKKESDIKEYEYKTFNRIVKKSDDYDPEFLKFDFAGNLTCNNNVCEEKIAVIGVKELLYDCDYNPQVIYYPKYFARPPKIITVCDEYPKEIRKALEDSFSLYWIDLASCLNRLRICIELLCDSLGSPRKNDKGKFIPLEIRIDSISEEFDFVKNPLKAAKWLGNDGTHGEDVSYQTIGDAFELLDYALLIVFKQKKIEALSNRIISERKENLSTSNSPA